MHNRGKQHLKTKKAIQVSLLTLAANLLLAGVKAVAGSLAGSSALVADAVHTASDSVSTLLVLGALRVADMPPDPRHPYGHGRAEAIAAKILGIGLFLLALTIIISAVKKLGAPQPDIPKTIALWVALVSILAKEWMFRLTRRAGQETSSNALEADAWHHRSDAISSIAALIGIAGARVGLAWLDPAAAVLVGAILVYTSVRIIISSIEEFMDTQADPETIERIAQVAKTVDGVVAVGQPRARRYGSQLYVELLLSVPEDITVRAGHEVARRVHDKLLSEMSEIGDIIVHVNPYPPGTRAVRHDAD